MALVKTLINSRCVLKLFTKMELHITLATIDYKNPINLPLTNEKILQNAAKLPERNKVNDAHTKSDKLSR